MKRILGLDLGTTSIGWALVNEAENKDEKSSIVKLGVRVVPLSTDEIQNFEKGKSITTEADRTLKRGMRRNLQRYKLRRKNLIDVLKSNHIITDETILSENGNRTTFETYKLRAQAATKEISLEQFARVLLMINKKRGYKSNRKANNQEEGSLINGMDIAKKLYDENMTPGEFVLELLKEGKHYIPDFYRSDLQNEFDKIWNKQAPYYAEYLTQDFKKQISNKSKTQTNKIFLGKYKIFTADNKGKDKKLQAYQWRVKALKEKLDINQLAYVVSDVNGDITSSSGYLGGISDRSKELFFKKITVGQYKILKLSENPNYSLKNKTFYRQDYLDEFEIIWETQAKFHKELTPDLKKEIRDIIIFYQRNLKSQKGLVGYCELESKQVEKIIDGKKKIITIGSKVCPKSSPFYQEYRIWQKLNDFIVINEKEEEQRVLTQDEKHLIANELNYKEKLSKTDILKILFKNYRSYDANFKELIGNRTNSSIYQALSLIISESGNGDYDFSKTNADEINRVTSEIFNGLGYKTNCLTFDTKIQGNPDVQPYYKLWHLLYSYEGDNSKTGDEKLIADIQTITGLPKEFAIILSKVKFEPDYGELSTKAIRKILPFLIKGNNYSSACELAGYNHSKRSLTKEEIENKNLIKKLQILPKNTLRNPVVEKILNQMINVINQLDDTYGKPDEIRIELARELKKSAEDRQELTDAINKSSAEYDEYKKLLTSDPDFHLHGSYISRKDLIKYKLYLELKDNGFKTLYSNTYIPKNELFIGDFEVEHIIPKVKLFDDSFSNKTLESSSCNREKNNRTAMDYVESKGHSDEYLNRIEQLMKSGAISRAKYNKLKMHESDIPDDFLNRDLGNTQYIARKANEILSTYVKTVVPTTGSITDRLREDWQLINVMQELNWDKYDKLGLTETFANRDGKQIRRIKDWTKRNDNRHHAMDALTIAFTKHSYIQYLNNLNAHSDKSSSIYAIEQKELTKNNHDKLVFNPPIPLNEFRTEAKKQLENILVSIKPKNKVVTDNVNITKKKGGVNKKIQATPRGQLHNESIYGHIKQYSTKEEKVGATFDETKISTVANKAYRVALLNRLKEFDGNAKKAFTAKNSLVKNPLFTDAAHSIKVPDKVATTQITDLYTIRKAVDKDLSVDKVVDAHVKAILESRLKEFGGDANKAFSNLDENPIWLNREKGISIKRVTIKGVNNVVALHDKKDKDGKLILDKNNNTQPTDFVSTGNNHHIAIYKDEKGELQEVPVSFFEATVRANNNLPIIDKTYKQSEGWRFMFTLKQNEYFVFPNPETGFDPSQIDLKDPSNYSLISPNLYRVQKIASKDYVFRHHLETNVNDFSLLMGLTFKRIRTISSLNGLIKVRLNHIGEIVEIGE
ncbi:MAG: type II CRISPR RNA-guided endonuclease Cas9 [Bacteroidales bacterium]|jgi:CRISPR-associated endonuclease Csn1|nr:type II CRISPR RNA-guided endonuclease Cas9 [Bacteroidales bacterium]